jgi:hypothetical protein
MKTQSGDGMLASILALAFDRTRTAELSVLRARQLYAQGISVVLISVKRDTECGQKE